MKGERIKDFVCVYLGENCSEKRYRELLQKTALGPQKFFFLLQSGSWSGYLHIFLWPFGYWCALSVRRFILVCTKCVSIHLLTDKCNFYMIFIILLFIKIVSFPLFLLIWFDLIFIYIYLFICALKEWEDFRLIYKCFNLIFDFPNSN